MLTYRLKLLLPLLMTSIALASFRNESDLSKVKLTVEGVEQIQGQLVINIYVGAKGFPVNPKYSFKELVMPLKVVNPSITFNLPKGDYAIAVFHDVNLNGKLDTNILSIPIEKTGVSNNPKVMFLPTFESAKFSLFEPKMDITIRLR